jgi:DNA polymerase-1
MKLALVSDQPYVSAATKQYVSGVIAAVSEMTAQDIQVAYVPAVAETQPGLRTPSLKVLRESRPDLMERLAASAPDAIVSMGAAALKALEPTTKAVTLKKEHGRMRMLDGIPWTPTVDAWRVAHASGGDLHRDFSQVIYKAVTQREPMPEVAIELLVARDGLELAEYLATLDRASVIGVDVETGGLSAYSDELTCIGFGAYGEDDDGNPIGVAVIVPREILMDPLVNDVMWDAAWRVSRRSVGHNFKFDMQFLERHIAWRPDRARIGDTLLLTHLLDERTSRPTSRARGSGLKDLVAQRYDLDYGFEPGFDRPYDSLTPEEVADLHAYLGRDVVYTARLWHDLEREAAIESPRIIECHDSLLVPVAVAVAKAELAGAPVDLAWVRETVEILDRRIARRRAAVEKAILKLAPTVVVTNVLSAQQVAVVLWDEWGWTPKPDKYGRQNPDDRSTDQSHIVAAIAKYGTTERARTRWAASLLSLRKDEKLRTTYQKSILGRADENGRVHASFLLHGASTGRISAREPALQTIPAVDDRREAPGGFEYKLRTGEWVRRPMRKAFAPVPGRVWVEVDYSQLELRVAAGISRDPDFTEVFTSGRDVHREVAAAIFSKAPGDVSKPERYLAKAVAFGILYGRTSKALAEGPEMDYAERELGMTRWTESVAETFVRKFLKSYPRLEEWISEMHVTVPEQGYVESPTGRRRRFPLYPRTPGELGAVQRQAVNTPIQGMASDICLRAFAEITRMVEDSEIDATVLFPVHDSICIECAESDISELERACRSVMEVPYEGVPLVVDFEWGPTWADTAKR